MAMHLTYHFHAGRSPGADPLRDPGRGFWCAAGRTGYSSADDADTGYARRTPAMFQSSSNKQPLLGEQPEDPFRWLRLLATVISVSLGSSLQFGFATGSLNNLSDIVPATLAAAGNPISIAQWAFINSCFSIGGLIGSYGVVVPLALLGRDAGAGVFDFDQRRCAQAQNDGAAVGRVLQGVVDQVTEQFLQQGGLAPNVERLLHLQRQFDIACMGQRHHGQRQLLCQRCQCHLLGAALGDGAGTPFNACHRQQPVS